MKAISRFIFVLGLGVMLWSGCATTTKRMEPVGQKPGQPQSEFMKGLAIVEQPALEPDWADFVKDHYPLWNRHYWVDRGQWGNRGYIVGKPTAAAEPIVEAITPLPPAAPVNQAPAIVESEPAKSADADKPTKYVVKKGDSLWKIAGRIYRNPFKWPKIYKANKEKVKHPNKIYPGQVLTIPWD